MGNICSCLCPKRRKSAKTSYDVHQQTFEMEQNIDSMNIDDNSPTITQEAHLTDQIDHEHKMSTEALISKEKHVDELKSSLSEKKYIETKMKVKAQKDELVEETTALNVDSQFNSQKNIAQQNVPSTQPTQQKSSENIKMQAQPIKTQSISTQPMQMQQPQKPKQQQKKPNPNILKPKTIKKKYNPDDYRFKDEVGQFKVKKIDSIKCQQYNIDNCKDSEYFIFDVTANVYIDDTSNCKIYIAPCESTIFVRNCRNLIIITATKQFRTYECHNCVFSLLCKSQPVIESSSELTFVPFEIHNYPQFEKQMNSIKLDPWNNHWSEIHNFTKKQGQVHYRLKRHLQAQQEMNWQKGFAEAQIEQNQQQCIVPFVQGQFSLELQNYSKFIIVFNKDVSKNDSQMIALIQSYRILKSFKGKVQGFGKDDRVALLLAHTEMIQNREKLQGSGQLFLDKQQVQKYQSQFFVNFCDQREK